MPWQNRSQRRSEPDGYVEELAVPALEALVGHKGGMGRAQALGSVAGGEVVAGLVGHPSDLGIEHGEVDVLAGSFAIGGIAMEEGGP